MNSQDLLIVARRFWPHAGLTELSLADLARNLYDAGHRVTVATVQSSKDWSHQVSFHDIPVVRLARPVAGPWSSFRYSRSLAKHFTTRRYDGIIVSGMGDEATAVIRTVNDCTPVILYIDEGYQGVTGKIHRKHIETCLSADAVIANTKPVADHLRRVDSAMPKISVIEPGLRTHSAGWAGNALKTANEHRSALRFSIRNALSKAHPVLRIEPDYPWVVACPRMNTERGVIDLIESWSSVLKHFPTAKLWLIGDGKRGGRIWQGIVERELSHSVMMPGYFDELSDIFLAADLYVHTGDESQSGDGLIRALSNGLPGIAFENDWTKSLIDTDRTRLLTPPNDSASLAKSILYALSNRAWLETVGHESAIFLSDRFPPARQAEQFAQRINSLSDQFVESAK